MDLEEGTPAWEHMRKEMQRAHKSCCQKVLEYNQSMEEYPLEFDSAPAMHFPAPKANDIPLSDLIGKYIAEQVRGGNWIPKTRRERTAKLNLLQEILSPSLPSAQVSIDHARQIKEALCKLPKNRSKNPKTRDLPLAEALATTDMERINVSTINKYLRLYDSLFNWAKNNQYVAHSHFHGLTLKSGKRQGEKRKAFTPAQLGLIYSALTENHNKKRLKDYQYWGALIGMFTGARLNEIAQIRTSDIYQEDGIWLFDINDKLDKARLKTKASRRKVPIHSRLLELGLLGFVEKVQALDKERLLYELSYTKGNGYGRNLGRWFNDKFLPSLSIKKRSLVFHSFRHTVVTRLLQEGVEDNIVKSIVGHAPEGVTHKNYFGGYKIKQLKNAIDNIVVN